MLSEFSWAVYAPEARALQSEYSSARGVELAKAKLKAAQSSPNPSKRKVKAAEIALARRTREHQTDLNAIQALEDATIRRERGERAMCSIEAASKLSMDSDKFERIAGLMKLPALIRYGASGVYEIETAMKAKIYTPGYELDRLIYEEEHGVSLE